MFFIRRQICNPFHIPYRSYNLIFIRQIIYFTAFQFFVHGVTWVIAYVIPDVPRDLELRMEREEYLAGQADKEHKERVGGIRASVRGKGDEPVAREKGDEPMAREKGDEPMTREKGDEPPMTNQTLCKDGENTLEQVDPDVSKPLLCDDGGQKKDLVDNEELHVSSSRDSKIVLIF